MLVFRDITTFQEWRSSLPLSRTVALVPTMGALHDGHAKLIGQSADQTDEILVTIFVNRIQFTQESDFANYPRTLDDDLRVCNAAGATAVLVPDDSELAPLLAATPIAAGDLGARFEGVDRPGHFDGVLTVVNQLFALTRPHRARFGEKDRQQLLIISRWAEDAWPDVLIEPGRTVREMDGLALSSRNRRLGTAARLQAASLSASLRTIQKAFASGVSSSSDLEALGRRTIASQCEIHYLAIIDPTTLDQTTVATDDSIALVAASVDGVRLIDNCRLGGAE